VTARAATLLVAAALAACDILDPPRYPDISGSYTIEVRFDGRDWVGTGDLLIRQEDRDEPTLSGGAVIALRWSLGGRPLETSYTNVHFTGATVDEAGAVRFGLNQSGYSWTFTGTRTGEGLAGEHDYAGLGSGTWTATWREP
jgi:hypothetical protein